MEVMKEHFRQIGALIEILKDVRPLCEDAVMAGMVGSALEGAETLQQMMLEATWPDLAEERCTGESARLPFPGEAFPAGDPAELCFPV